MGKILQYEKQYGRLAIISEPFRKYAKETSTQESTYVKAVCECGNIGEYVVRDLKNGTTSSCGCLRKELSGQRNKTHGCASIINKDYIYKVWIGIKKRCYSVTEAAYKYYGARGIVMCEEWLNDFTVFKEWALNNGWEKGLHTDRIDNNKGYEPSNCRFVSKRVSTRNRRFVKLDMVKAEEIRLLYSNDKMRFVDIAKVYGVNANTISSVVKNKTWTSN